MSQEHGNGEMPVARSQLSITECITVSTLYPQYKALKTHHERVVLILYQRSQLLSNQCRDPVGDPTTTI